MQMNLRYVVMTNWDLSSLWTNTSATLILFFLDKEESYHLIGVGKPALNSTTRIAGQWWTCTQAVDNWTGQGIIELP